MQTSKQTKARQLDFGVRQGSVMSPLLFAVYVDDLAKSCDCSRGMYFMQTTFYYRASAYGTPLDGATVKVVITTVNKT